MNNFLSFVKYSIDRNRHLNFKFLHNINNKNTLISSIYEWNIDDKILLKNLVKLNNSI